MNFICVAIGGGLGCLLRYFISIKFNKKVYGTWIANISGSILLAFVFHMYINSQISELTWLLAGIGFCGAYTTFSTFGHETLTFLIERKYFSAVFYIVSSFLVSLLSIAFILSFFN